VPSSAGICSSIRDRNKAARGEQRVGNEARTVTRLFHLDEPASGFVMVPAVPVRGWIIDDGVREIRSVSLRSEKGASVPLKDVDRPDVRATAPGVACAGFGGWIDIATAARGPWHLHYEHEGGANEFPIDLGADPGALESFRSAKERKLAAILPLLRCPVCEAPIERGFDTVRCTSGHLFPPLRGAYDLLDPMTRTRAGVVATDNVSEHGYDPVLRDMIAQCTGPIVDVGAGLRPEYRADVINLDIVAYPTTDVIAASERLPFADETFDLVISVAVLEHVRDPFQAARELVRIMRPGGRIYAAVPFLQPYHGYPGHYYNMTSEGLRNLFPDVTVERLEVPDAGLPIFTLTWILQSWRRALGPELAEDFDRMTVAELAVDPMTLIEKPFVRALPPHVNDVLAALNLLIGRKSR
jgi:SAM-dependent methyltransferase